MVYWYVWIRVVFVTVGGFHFGYDLGSMNGVKDMGAYRNTLGLPLMGNGTCGSADDVDTTVILGVIVTLLSLGALLGALAAGFLSDFAGRKPAIIIGASLVSIGGLLHTAAVNLVMVYISRFTGGVGLGIVFQVIPIYVAEISPERQRGRMQTFFIIYGSAGILAGNVVNFFVKDLSFGWRLSLGIQFAVATVLALGTFLLPRSPRWLVERHREKQALGILTKIYVDETIAETQLEEIKSAVSRTKEPFIETLKFVLQCKILQRQVMGYTVMFVGRCAGISFFTYFSVSLFNGIGLPGFAVSMGLGIAVVLAMILSLAVIDKLGRKPILLIGLFMMMLGLVGSSSLILGLNLDCPSEISQSQQVAGYFVVAFVYLYVAAATITTTYVKSWCQWNCNPFSCILFLHRSTPWIVVSEIFPLRGRGLMVSVSTSGFWFGLIVVNLFGPILASTKFGNGGTLFLFSGISLYLFLFVLLVLPETKDLTLEKIEELFSKPWLERANVFYYLRCACFLELVSKKKQESLANLSLDQQSNGSVSQLEDEDSLEVKVPDGPELQSYVNAITKL